MKFKVGDQVIVTAGKDKGKKGKVVKLLIKQDRVVVEGVNLYTKHIRPVADRPGDKIKKERPLPTANIAILNDKDQADRIGYKIAKDGSKERIFKKTGKVIPELKVETKSSKSKKK